MARKTAKDYRKDYADLLIKTKGLEAKVKARAEELCNANPTLPIGSGAVAREIDKFKLNTFGYICVIEHIEKYLADQHPHQQQKLFK
jgi:hypothetical protein